jgi:YD repeat-containing protein
MPYSVMGLDPSNNYGIGYDANGNILTMRQDAPRIGSSNIVMDALHYFYCPNSNKLKFVGNEFSDSNSRLGNFHDSPGGFWADDYGYDVNGNMTIDLNKNIGSQGSINTITGLVSSGAGIIYNHLNLPRIITVAGKGTIEYVYDAAGNKLKKIITEGSKVTTTLYMFGNYINDTLQFLPLEQGRIRPAANSTDPFVYDYFIKDQLGNVRMVLTEENRQDAYPAATMEATNSTTEEALYANITNTRNDLPSGYPTDTYTNTNYKVAKTNGSGNKIGPAIALKVMAVMCM